MGKNNKNWLRNKKNKRPSNFNKNKYNGKKYIRSPHKPQQPKGPRQCLREDQVGITEFVSKGVGFTGVLKSRFSDFHVNEIDTKGVVLHLTDLTVPKPPEETLDEEELANARKEFIDIISPEVWEKIEALAGMKASDPAAKAIDIKVTPLDKEKRTKIHNILKQLYGHKIVTSTITLTIDSKDERFVKIMKPKGKPGENRKKWTFPGEYVHFLVYKENIETSEAAAKLAAHMGMHPSKINYCGTKDKRAKTTQKFCVKRREPSHIVSAANNSKLRIGNFEFSNEVLKLGDLKGNRFRIALRHVNGVENEIEKSLVNLRENGFINYFGLQRFGTHPGSPTYEIGVALLKSDYKAVVELILKPRENDLNFMDKIRKFWWENRNSTVAAAMFHSKNFIEKMLLDGLAEYGEQDYSSALRKIPRNMLLLYPHSFQSLVFNRIASRRIQKFGMQLMPGDLVYRNKEEMDEDNGEKTSLDIIAEDQLGEVNEAIESEMPEDTEDAAAEPEKVEDVATDAVESVFKRKVKPLTEEDIASGEYTLFDIVLPLPGYDITYPDNEVGNWYKEMLQEYGLTSENLRHKVKTYSLAGAYRKLLIRPTELTWKFQRYSSPDAPLIASDWDYITRKAAGIEKDTKEGHLKALLLDFCLPPSVYATMLLRELLKSDTSIANQMQIENDEITKANENTNEPEYEDNENIATADKRKFYDDDFEPVDEKKMKDNDEN